MRVLVGLIVLITLLLFVITGYAQPVCPPLPPTVSNIPNIIEDPTNETKDVGELTFCVCKFSNTPDSPAWRINETSYMITDLPSIFEVNETGLLFNASATLHNARFQCYFIICTQLEGCCEIQSSPGYLTLRQQVTPENIADCKPVIVEILVPDAQDGETATIAWIPNPDCDRSPFSYITEVATCQTPQSSPSILCRIPSSTSTNVVINTDSCPGISLRDTQPVLFRVQTAPEILSPSISSYIYTSQLNITDIMQGEVNRTITISRPGGMFCSYGYKICINELYSDCFDISNLPPGHRDCTSDNVPKLCIDISDQSLDGSVYTLLCPQISVPDCNISSAAVDVLTYNFRLIINGTDSDDVCGILNKGECIGAMTATAAVLVLAVLIVLSIIIIIIVRRHMNKKDYELPNSENREANN